MAKDKASRKEAQERLAAERARQAATERRRVWAFVGVGVVLIGAVVLAVVFSLAGQESDKSASGATPKAAMSANGGIPTGPTAAKAETKGIPVVDVYSDYQCPACKSFEDNLGATLSAFADEGSARVIYHGINLLGPQFTGSARTSSLRAASAAGCASDADKFLPFHTTAFAQQGTEGKGISDDQLVQWGKDAGITGPVAETFESCVRDESYVAWVKRVDAESRSANVTSTPTIFVNGKEITPDQRASVEVFKNTVLAATKKP